MTTPTTQTNEKRSPWLKPYHFKPGNHASPGRPKAILTKKERLELLAAIARHNIEAPVSAGHKIAAIKEQNLMEHIYEEDRGNLGIPVVNTFIFVLADGTRVTPGQLIEGKAKVLPEGK